MSFRTKRHAAKLSEPPRAAEPVKVSAPQAAIPPFDDLPYELIAARAYEKWQRRGCPMGQDGLADWYAARAELEQERLHWATPRESDRRRV